MGEAAQHQTHEVARIPHTHARALTEVPYVEQHGDEDVVDEIEADPVGEDGVPHDEQVLHRELASEQQPHPPATTRAPHPDYRSTREVHPDYRPAHEVIADYRSTHRGHLDYR